MMFTGKPGTGNHQHRAAEHRPGLHEAPDRLVDDPNRDSENGEAVGEGNQRFHAAEAVGEAHRGRAFGEMEGIPGEPQRDGIGQHVAGIGEQRQRAGDPAADRFRDHEAAGQKGRDQHTRLVARAAAMHMARAMRVPRMGMVVVAVRVRHESAPVTK